MLKTKKKNEIIPFVGFTLTMLFLVSALSFQVNGLLDIAKTTLLIAILTMFVSSLLNYIVNLILNLKP